jgi:hypothetical protein
MLQAEAGRHYTRTWLCTLDMQTVIWLGEVSVQLAPCLSAPNYAEGQQGGKPSVRMEEEKKKKKGSMPADALSAVRRTTRKK